MRRSLYRYNIEIFGALGLELSPIPSVGLSVCMPESVLWKNAVVSGVGRGMGVLDGDGDRRRGRSRLEGPTVTNGDFVAYVCESDAPFPNYFGRELF